MPRDQLSDQMAYPPRAMRARNAAAYLSISVRTFHRLVASGVIPQPIRLGGAVAWDRYALDALLDGLGDEHENTIIKLLAQRTKQNDQTAAQHKAPVRKVRERLRLLPTAERKTDPAAD
jgi:predicted DNA-binding transcriptional regulator AlpA